MKPHIAQTIAELRYQGQRLNEMIAVLEYYGANSDPAAPAPPEQTPPPPVERPDPPRPRRVSLSRPRKAPPVPSDLPKRTSYQKRAGLGAKELVREAIAALTDPFTLAQVREYLTAKYPEFKPGRSTISVAICNLRDQEDIRDAGKVGTLSAYKKAPGFKHSSGMSDKEVAYKKLRDEMPPPPHVAD